ncbi:MAG: 7TM-DISM domain-containing protein, partial [Desulfobacterales bacterium]|nr:7TM-DISM domain-containing protein [Desulfobacterales bacterium]
MNFLLVGSLRHRIKAAALIFVVAVLAGLLPSCNNSEYHRPPPKVVDGVIDLRHWDFEKSGPVKLDGAWRFRWHRFFRPGASDDNGGGASENHGFITVPGPWNATVRRLTGEDNQLPETGFATYGLTILLPPEDRILALRTEAIFASGEIFINGRLIFSQGNPGTSREDSVGRIRPGVAGFHSGGGKTELRVNASNFHWRIGGIIDPIHIGLPHQIQTIRDRNLNFEVFSFGILLFMSLYHLLLFAIRPSDKSPLFFALFCLEVCLRVVVKGERLVLHVLPFLDDHFFGAAEYLTLPMGVLYFGLFLRSVFPEDMFRRIWYLLMGISVCLCLHAVSGDVLTVS